jgi:hypothetical protein
LAHVIGPGDIGLRFAVGEPRKGLLALCPSLVRARIIDRSNSARAANTAKISFPCGDVVSIIGSQCAPDLPPADARQADHKPAAGVDQPLNSKPVKEKSSAAAATGNPFARHTDEKKPSSQNKYRRMLKLEPAQLLLDWLIADQTRTLVTTRDICNRGPNAIRNRECAIDSAKILVEHGWLIPLRNTSARHALVANRAKAHLVPNRRNHAVTVATNSCYCRNGGGRATPITHNNRRSNCRTTVATVAKWRSWATL